MAQSQPENPGPLAISLPVASTDKYFSDAQWTTLLAILDTVIPSVTKNATNHDPINQLVVSEEEYDSAVEHIKANVANPPSKELLDRYLEESPSRSDAFQQVLRRTLEVNLPEESRKGLRIIMAALNTRLGSLFLTGYAKPIQEQPIVIRQAILQSWVTTYITPLNTIYRSMLGLGKNTFLKTSSHIHEITGYPTTPKDYKPGNHFKYQFENPGPGKEPHVIETDVVIVGSGCGGAVCAKNLAEAGHRVLVVDKGFYFKPESFPMGEKEAAEYMYEGGGVVQTDDGSVAILAGSTWGGGGTVNWAASLQAQDFVRKQWAQERRLTFFETAEFQMCLDRVCHRMGVTTDIKHNHGNRVILESGRRLGMHVKTVPQNTGNAEHYCGTCTLGCHSGGKQGPVITWLPDAAKAGAKFLEGFNVDHIIFDESNGNKTATGIRGTWTSRNSKGTVDGSASDKIVREVIVRARTVVISCGTLNSPLVLLKSGLKNPQIGRNTYLHPVNTTVGVFKDDIQPWEGGALTAACTSLEDLDGHGHGIKIEATAMIPSYALTLLSWSGGFDWKVRALKFRHMNSLISIVRDRDTGRVYPDPVSGKPRIQYTPSAFDRAHIMEGNVAMAKMLYLAGAREIYAAHQGLKPFIRDVAAAETATDIDPGITDPNFAAFLAEMRRLDNKPDRSVFASAHQMGSCRMSASEKDGVVDPRGKVWGTQGLYVSDASVFPTASGVNPMITNMAISDWISRGISKDMHGVVTESKL